MRFDVGTLLRGATGSVQTFTVEDILEAEEEESGPSGRTTGAVKLMKSGRGVLVTARLDIISKARCSRCDKPLTAPVHIDFEEEYVATAEPRTGAPLPPPEEEDDDSFLIDEHQILDIAEAVRQYALVAEPMQSLCRPDCKGLCPQCGKDLNEGPCSCDYEIEDSYVSVLSSLRDGIDSDKE